ncbi:MAG TPA: RNA polymerase sigma factor [Bryobacteraceae bacterium]|jgi:RNA polymerase sigma-70 factor (ECF subfamily)|nr:RNA polymerase sigma factor [Bryobacteraceae bacterium]
MDEESFCAFYEQTARKLRSYLRSALRDEVTLADDILQESYLRFLKADLPIGMDELWRRNYLYRIATNLIRDHRRSRHMESPPNEREYATHESSLDEARDIRQVFGRLKPKERDLLWLAYVEGFSHSEIAGMVQAGTASIRPMLARARANFAGMLKRRGYGA